MSNSFLCTLFASFLLSVPLISAQKVANPGNVRIELPAPVRTGGMSLNEALALRRSVRLFESTELTPQEISQLLWSAQGITDDQGHRAAPSAHAQYYLHIYVAQAEGFFEYLPAANALQRLSSKDLRGTLSSQQTVKTAPIVFLIAGEYDRARKGTDRETGFRLVNLEAGHAAQNLLLQATALKLGGVSVGGIDPKQTARTASLPVAVTPIYLIPVGHEK
jgi:SagB-type dehydrogenase family enzyme